MHFLNCPVYSHKTDAISVKTLCTSLIENRYARCFWVISQLVMNFTKGDKHFNSSTSQLRNKHPLDRCSTVMVSQASHPLGFYPFALEQLRSHPTKWPNKFVLPPYPAHWSLSSLV